MRHEFAVIAAWSVDRLGHAPKPSRVLVRNPHEGSRLEPASAGDRHDYACWESSFPHVWRVCGIRARDDSERVRSGLARAKAQGTKSGRTIGRPRVNLQIE